MRKYTTDDLINLAKIGNFGDETTNSLALQAFARLKQLELENSHLKTLLNALVAPPLAAPVTAPKKETK